MDAGGRAQETKRAADALRVETASLTPTVGREEE
jgi:hypothetical protein